MMVDLPGSKPRKLNRPAWSAVAVGTFGKSLILAWSSSTCAEDQARTGHWLPAPAKKHAAGGGDRLRLRFRLLAQETPGLLPRGPVYAATWISYVLLPSLMPGRSQECGTGDTTASAKRCKPGSPLSLPGHHPIYAHSPPSRLFSGPFIPSGSDGLRMGPENQPAPVGTVSSVRKAALEFPHRIDHRHDVLHGRSGLDVVNGVEDESAARGKYLATLENLLPHLFRRAEREDLLRIHAAAPENDAVAIPLFQVAGSMPAAEHCTGLRMSNPHSMKEAMKRPRRRRSA